MLTGNRNVKGGGGAEAEGVVGCWLLFVLLLLLYVRWCQYNSSHNHEVMGRIDNVLVLS